MYLDEPGRLDVSGAGGRIPRVSLRLGLHRRGDRCRLGSKLGADVKMRKTALWSVFALFLIASIAAAMDPVEAEARRILKADWSVGAKPSVLFAKFSKEGINYFLFALVNSSSSSRQEMGGGAEFSLMDKFGWEAAADFSRIPGGLGKVTFYWWADVDADAVYELLALEDAGGTGGSNNLYIIKRSGRGFTHQGINFAGATGIRDSLSGQDRCCGLVLTDMDQDGRLELVIPFKVGFHCTACASPIWPAVMKWEGGRYAEADERFKAFYRDFVLPGVERRIASLERRSWPKGEFFDDLAAERVIKDKLQRFLGIDPRAGFDRAVDWARDQRLEPRLFALDEFGDIPGEESSRWLRLMAENKETSVWLYARRLLRDRIHTGEIDRYSLEFLDAQIDEFMGRFRATKEGALFLTQHPEKDLREVLKFLQDPRGFSGPALALADLCACLAAIRDFRHKLAPRGDPSDLATEMSFGSVDAENIALLTSLMLRCDEFEVRSDLAIRYTQLFEVHFGAIVKDLEQRANWKDVIQAASAGDKRAFFIGLSRLGDSPFERELKAYAQSLKWLVDE